MESRQKRTDKKVASKGHRRDKIENINKKCTNDLLSLQQYNMFNVFSIAGTVVADLFYTVYYYYLLNYMLYGHTNSMSMVQPGK